jgi:hypothetical protein
MEKSIRLLRISFWAAAIADGATAYLMIKVAVFGATSSLTGYTPGIEYRYGMGICASLMLGWTALLVWGDRKPVERKGVLALTVFPVITGIFITTYLAYLAGFMPIKGTVMICGINVALIVLLSYSYLQAIPKK